MYVLFWILNYQSRHTMAFDVMESEIEIFFVKTDIRIKHHALFVTI